MLSAGLGARGLDVQILEIYAVEEAADALRPGRTWINKTPHTGELAMLRECKGLFVRGRVVRQAIKPGRGEDG